MMPLNKNASTADFDPTDPRHEWDRMTTDQKLDLILIKMTRTEEMVAKVIEEVKPTLDELMNSSLFKMLGVKKK